MAGLLDWVDPAREWWQSRPEALRGLLSGAYSLATDPAAREAAMARQPKPFTDESAKASQAMAEGFWNPGGLLGAIGMTKFEKAHKVAQKNAALPVEKGGLGLPKNNTAADRAKAMGFDTDAYHGTVGDIRAFNPQFRGSVTGAPSAKKADFAATNPDIATGYSLIPEGRQVAIWQRELANAEGLGNFDKVEELTRKIEEAVYGKRNLMNALSDERDAASNAFSKVLVKYNVTQDYYSHRPDFGDYKEVSQELARQRMRRDALDKAMQRVPDGGRDLWKKFEEASGGKATWETVPEYEAIAKRIGQKDKKLEDLYRASHDGRWETMPEFRKDPALISELQDAYNRAAKVDAEWTSNLAPEGANVMPLKVRTQGFLEKDFRGGRYRDESYNELIKNAGLLGKPGVVMKNTYDPGQRAYDELTNVLAIRDPSRIRSRFAAFDPARKHEADLLAGYFGFQLPQFGNQ